MIEKGKRILTAIIEFFPINLLISHIKYNNIMLLYWIVLFGVINNYIGEGIGLSFLFLSPEYLEASSPVAFMLLGAGIGGFIMAYHIYSYVQLGPLYPFIATLSRPFYKFSYNNSIIPLAFIINLAVNIFQFQKSNEYIGTAELSFQIISFLGGIVSFIVLALLYFLPTNKDLFKITGKKSEDFQADSTNVYTTLHRHRNWYRHFLVDSDKRYFYLSSTFKIKRSRSSAHYDINILNKVFNQNHVNASVFEILLLISFVIIGLFRDYELFQFPSAVSIMMLLTIIIMVVSALFSWFKAWTFPVLIIFLFFVNYVNKNTKYLQFKSYAYGLSYEKEDLLKYHKNSALEATLSDSIVQRDLEEYIQTLENWKEKTGERKPKLIVVNTSGGGLRSAMWTFKVLQTLDSLTQNEVSTHIQMMTGASGGTIGAAYYRDLLLMEKDSSITRLDKKYLDNISKDLLNRLSFSIPTNDLFFRIKKKEINGYEYVIDRGYEFEQELIYNLDGAFNRTLGDYTQVEKNADIPTMILTPTIVNDGRRLIIGSQHHGYLQKFSENNEEMGLHLNTENIEYLKFFDKINPKEINFTTVLRMSATFPYIMPMISMPTTPNMFIMDAGIRDNYGYKVTVQYLVSLQKWIKENTSGVIVLRIRDNIKDLIDNDSYDVGFYRRFILPFGNMYGNFLKMQDYNQDEMFSVMIPAMDFPVDVVTFNLREQAENKISLSWHLTAKEKEKVKTAINSENNKQATLTLLKLMNLISEDRVEL